MAAAEPVREARDRVPTGDHVADHSGRADRRLSVALRGDAQPPAASQSAVVALELAQVAPHLGIGGSAGAGPSVLGGCCSRGGILGLRVRGASRLREGLGRFGVPHAGGQRAARDRARHGRRLRIVLQHCGGAEGSRDWDAVLSAAGPDFELVTSDRATNAGIYRGPEAARGVLQDLFEPFESATAEVEEFLVQDDRIVVLLTMRFRPRGSTAVVENRIAHLWTAREGRLVRLQVFPERELAIAAAGLSVETPSGRVAGPGVPDLE